MMNAYELAAEAANELRQKSGVDQFDVAVVLGSGWKEGAVALGEPDSVVATSELTGFFKPTVAGHQGQILSVKLAGLRVALLAGRVHLYEGHTAHEVAHPIRTLIAAGAKKIVLTNACGGIDIAHGPGTVALIRDHINLTSTSPMEGELPPEQYGSRFVDLSNLYDAETRARIQAVHPMPEGVYAGFRGPHYETPAEIKMASAMGATLVGMSTVLEAIAARHLGAQVTSLGLISNYAAGVVPGGLNHLEVLEAGQKAAASLGTLLKEIIPVL
jgi:purine-nucleoside phosphorylase